MINQSEIGDASRVRVSGPGLSEARTFEPAEFIIDTRDAGYGGLSLSIEGPFADQHVPGSAFTVKVTGEGRMKESITRKRRGGFSGQRGQPV
ncbi:hypothetical protein KUCAC02_037887 [Chaenocephalus aceratus]|nr:hypothetical protein KUCAC02_037887 [Chaenocephalus aceratus]